MSQLAIEFVEPGFAVRVQRMTVASIMIEIAVLGPLDALTGEPELCTWGQAMGSAHHVPDAHVAKQDAQAAAVRLRCRRALSAHASLPIIAANSDTLRLTIIQVKDANGCTWCKALLVKGPVG